MPIDASGLGPNEIDLFPGKEHMKCPFCETWSPITGMQGRPKLVPHDTRRHGTAKARRCRPGSNRLVLLEARVGVWQQTLTEGASEASSRRATAVRKKPTVASVPAVAQMRPSPMTAERARGMFREHQLRCAHCQGRGQGAGEGRVFCRDGQRLAATFLRLLRVEAQQRELREFFARERRRFDAMYRAHGRRARQWATCARAARDADIQRVRDELMATLWQLSGQLDRVERAVLDQRITVLTERLQRL
ncbi:hypothetical protein [Streptomyces sp. N35]|uniref:hypothetical protein n=1 Tax=Streptomyces sp. N35 TaxID=2795730 RepID=UPI0018F4C5B1|nr:hypothetical protein [Streptomyces sp. N35]